MPFESGTDPTASFVERKQPFICVSIVFCSSMFSKAEAEQVSSTYATSLERFVVMIPGLKHFRTSNMRQRAWGCANMYNSLWLQQKRCQRSHEYEFVPSRFRFFQNQLSVGFSNTGLLQTASLKLFAWCVVSDVGPNTQRPSQVSNRLRNHSQHAPMRYIPKHMGRFQKWFERSPLTVWALVSENGKNEFGVWGVGDPCSMRIHERDGNKLLTNIFLSTFHKWIKRVSVFKKVPVFMMFKASDMSKPYFLTCVSLLIGKQNNSNPLIVILRYCTPTLFSTKWKSEVAKSPDRNDNHLIDRRCWKQTILLVDQMTIPMPYGTSKYFSKSREVMENVFFPESFS